MDSKARRATLLVSVLSVVVLMAALTAPAAVIAGDKAPPAPPPSHAFGESLNEWIEVYWRTAMETYFFADGEVYVDKVLLLPIPQGEYVSGKGTYNDPALFVGELEITVRPGTPFVLPFNAWVGETYDPTMEPAQPDDEMVPREDVTSANIEITLDGRTLIDSDKDDLDKYYYEFWFDPPIYYDEPDPERRSVGAIWAQGIGFIHPPLSVGTHTLTLTSNILVPPGVAQPADVYPDGLGEIYQNTWTITVTK